MTPHQTAAILKAGIDSLEAHIEALPEGDVKATATHHAVRIHHHLTALARMAIARGDVSTDSVGGDKPPA